MTKGNKKEHYLNIRVNSSELEVIKRISEALGYETISDAVRSLFRFANVFFDENLTVKKAIKSHMLRMLIEDKKFRETVPIADIFKTIPQLEKEINKSYTA